MHVVGYWKLCNLYNIIVHQKVSGVGNMKQIIFITLETAEKSICGPGTGATIIFRTTLKLSVDQYQNHSGCNVDLHD